VHWQTIPSPPVAEDSFLTGLNKYVAKFTGSLLYLPPTDGRHDQPVQQNFQPPITPHFPPNLGWDDDSSSEEKCKKKKVKNIVILLQ